MCAVELASHEGHASRVDEERDEDAHKLEPSDAMQLRRLISTEVSKLRNSISIKQVKEIVLTMKKLSTPTNRSIKIIIMAP